MLDKIFFNISCYLNVQREFLSIEFYAIFKSCIYRYTHVITSTKFRLKQTWRLTKTIAEMKCDTEQMMKLE